MIINPSFYEMEGNKEKGYDLFSRLLKERIVLLFNDINDDLACTVIAILRYILILTADRFLQALVFMTPLKILNVT